MCLTEKWIKKLKKIICCKGYPPNLKASPNLAYHPFLNESRDPPVSFTFLKRLSSQ